MRTALKERFWNIVSEILNDVATYGHHINRVAELLFFFSFEKEYQTRIIFVIKYDIVDKIIFNCFLILIKQSMIWNSIN